MPTPPGTSHTTNAFSWRFVTPLLTGSAINAINSSFIATALVPIAAAVHVSVGRTAVLVSALYLASAVAQPMGGKLAEEFGPRRVFLVGVLIVLAGGIVGGVGQNLTGLVVSRVLIGVGSSAVYPSAMLLIRRRAAAAGLDAPPGGVLGSLMIAGAATSALGLPLGGVLVDVWGWRTTFLINLPFALLALAMAFFWIPSDLPVEGPRTLREVAARLDMAGIVGFGGAMAALLVFLMGLPRPDWIALGLAVVAGKRGSCGGSCGRAVRSSTYACWARTWRSPAPICASPWRGCVSTPSSTASPSGSRPAGACPPRRPGCSCCP
ncbi:MFS transporter [Streptomyces sp. MCA2]|uniref:MFS transporter n=1 Tax=Streptomyces sp. MCA2 TaxID=2944805 RepID=UPI002022575E|nr:MFS transporter [Streptomyces sp. MCA2]MCL7493957.1 MFS transporter [Streptomyces sp. MCA2]